METTKLYVEYIVVGMETLAIIFLVIFIIIGNAFLPIIKYCIKNIVPSIIMLGWCYILGLIVDRIADIIYDKRKMHIKEKYPIVAETSIIVWEHFKQDAFATFTLSIVSVVIIHQRQVALRRQGTGFLVGHGNGIRLIRSGSQDRLLHFLHRLTAIGKSRSCHASAQCHRQHRVFSNSYPVSVLHCAGVFSATVPAA